MPIKFLRITTPSIYCPTLDESKFVQQATSSKCLLGKVDLHHPNTRNSDPNAGPICGQDVYCLA